MSDPAAIDPTDGGSPAQAADVPDYDSLVNDLQADAENQRRQQCLRRSVLAFRLSVVGVSCATAMLLTANSPIVPVLLSWPSVLASLAGLCLGMTTLRFPFGRMAVLLIVLCYVLVGIAGRGVLPIR